MENNNCGRIRKWPTDHGVVLIHPDCSVLPGYLHGGDYAVHLADSKRKGSSGSKGRPRIRLVKPPIGGWK